MDKDGRKKIVVLDDNEIFAALIAAALEDHCRVLLGHTGLQGIAYFLEGGVDAVVTDISMPDFDGLRMLEEMNRNPALRHIPVIVVTATHFNTIGRSSVSRYPQVMRMLNKQESVDRITAEVLDVLTGGGRAGL
ncbi:MAG: response regulator [Elusimicrobiales bacterium]|nr:response regulator [Elusimicrobiales bacterium]